MNEEAKQKREELEALERKIMVFEGMTEAVAKQRELIVHDLKMLALKYPGEAEEILRGVAV